MGSPDLPGDLQELGTLLKATTDEVPARVAALVAELQQADAKANPATLAGDDLTSRVQALQAALKKAKKAAAAAAATAALAQVDDLLARTAAV